MELTLLLVIKPSAEPINKSCISKKVFVYSLATLLRNLEGMVKPLYNPSRIENSNLFRTLVSGNKKLQSTSTPKTMKPGAKHDE